MLTNQKPLIFVTVFTSESSFATVFALKFLKNYKIHDVPVFYLFTRFSFCSTITTGWVQGGSISTRSRSI